MKKNATIFLAIVMACILIACLGSKNDSTSENQKLYLAYDDLFLIPGSHTLTYSIHSKTVYYWSECVDNRFLCDYIFDGHNCEYIDGKIVVVPCCDENCRYADRNTIVEYEETN